MQKHYVVPLIKSTLGCEEVDRAVTVLKSDRFTMGDLCAGFEDAFAAFLGVRNAVMVNSGKRHDSTFRD